MIETEIRLKCDSCGGLFVLIGNFVVNKWR